MTEPIVVSDPAFQEGDEISMLVFASFLLRWRRTILAVASFGLVLGLGAALLTRRVYSSTAIFIPQGPDGGRASGFALAASQFGFELPNTSGGWGPPIYVELLLSRALLESIAFDTVAVAEQGGKRVTLMDLLDIHESSPARQLHLSVLALRKIVDASEEKKLGAVRVTVTTRWPSVSLALAERLVRGVDQFNLETRKSQASAERQFVEGQAAETERALRDAEDRLQLFLQRNRSLVGSPELAFERDRLQREVTLRQSIYTSLLQSREEARIREVRDIPVITMLEDPRRAAVSESRRVLAKGLLGALAGVIFGMLTAFVAQGVAGARQDSNDEAREFFQMVEEATPRFLRRGTRA
jgi:hypothetical protein